jgi:hypothetical protein
MPGSDHQKVAAIERQYARHLSTLGDRYDGGVDKVQLAISILLQYLPNPVQIGPVDRFENRVARSQLAQEAAHSSVTQPGGKQIADLGQDRQGENERLIQVMCYVEHTGVVAIAGVSQRKEATGVQQNAHD